MKSLIPAEPRLQDILDAIARARVADKRMRLGESLGDDVGVQVAFQAILHNLSVIGEAVKGMPVELLDRAPETPWSEIAGLGEALGHNYLVIVPASIHRIVEADLGALESAVRRLIATG